MLDSETARFVGELETARAKYQTALFDLHYVIVFCQQSDATRGTATDRTTAALDTVTRKLTQAGEVYDLALLELVNYWHRSKEVFQSHAPQS